MKEQLNIKELYISEHSVNNNSKIITNLKD